MLAVNPIEALDAQVVPVVHISPIRGTPQWWHVTNLDGLSFSGAFPWAERGEPSDPARHERFQLAHDLAPRDSKSWRFASMEEASAVLWQVLVEQ